MSDQIILVNKNATNSFSVLKYFKNNNVKHYYLKGDDANLKFIKKNVFEGNYKFLLCGGDGTINKFVNLLMRLPRRYYDKVIISIIPSGRANDLAREMKINPKEKNKLFSNFQRYKKIDLVNLNGVYFITGGGFGLPAEVIRGLNKKNKIFSRILSVVLNSEIYSIQVLKNLIFGYKPVKYKGKEYMAICIMNQGSIGRKFSISPKSINNDSYFEVCYVNEEKNLIKKYGAIRKIVKGKYFGGARKLRKLKEFKIGFNEDIDFMADGEIISKGKNFTFRICPKRINIAY